MPNMRVEITEEMDALLREYCFQQGTQVAPFVRELVRRELEQQTGVQLNANIGPAGRHAPPRPANAQARFNMAVQRAATQPGFGPRSFDPISAPIPTMDPRRAEQLINSLLDNVPQPGDKPLTIDKIIERLSGAVSPDQVRNVLQKRRIPVPASDIDPIGPAPNQPSVGDILSGSAKPDREI